MLYRVHVYNQYNNIDLYIVIQLLKIYSTIIYSIFNILYNYYYHIIVTPTQTFIRKPLLHQTILFLTFNPYPNILQLRFLVNHYYLTRPVFPYLRFPSSPTYSLYFPYTLFPSSALYNTPIYSNTIHPFHSTLLHPSTLVSREKY